MIRNIATAFLMMGLIEAGYADENTASIALKKLGV
jgi:hypothetical protein